MNVRELLIGCLAISTLGGGQNLVARTQFGNFTITPRLSPKAMRTLISRKETVIVSAMISARPKPGVRTHYFADSVPDNLGTKDIEVAPGAAAKFGRITVPHDPRHRLNENAPNLLINVVSGRRSSADNLLECDIYESTLASASGKNIFLHCKLIDE